MRVKKEEHDGKCINKPLCTFMILETNNLNTWPCVQVVFLQYLIFLPASQNFKIVHQYYVKATMQQDSSQRVMEYRSFVTVWHKCIPFMTPQMDVCSKCERFRHQLKECTFRGEKSISYISFVSAPQTEREHYPQCCKCSASELGSCSGGALRLYI